MIFIIMIIFFVNLQHNQLQTLSENEFNTSSIEIIAKIGSYMVFFHPS